MKGGIVTSFPKHITCGVIFLLVFASVCRAGATRIVAQSGDASPDGNGVMALFAGASINDSGQIGFLTQVTGSLGGTADNTIVLRGDSEDLTIIARNGQSLPGSDVISGFAITGIGINAVGEVMEVAVIDTGGTFPELVPFSGNGGSLSVFPRAGDPSPGGNNQLVGASLPAITNSGVWAYRGVYPGGNPELGIYRRDPNGTLTTLALESTAAPRGGVFEQLGFGLPHINDAAQVALTADVMDNSHSLVTLLRIDGATVNELVREGDMLADGITTIESIYKSRTPINSQGQIAFTAGYSQPGKLPEGVFLADENGVTLLAGQVLPGGPSAISDAFTFGLNDAGQVGLFTGYTTGTDDAVYLVDDQGAILVAKERALAPQGGRYFKSINSNSLALNEQGQIAFMADLSDTVGGAKIATGLFLYDPNDGLQQVITTGDSFNSSTIAGLFFYGSITNSSRPMSALFDGLNNNGELAFFFSLADTRGGVAVWSFDLAGDLNGDGFVGIGDLNIVLGNWNQDVTAGDKLAGDPSGDGFVGIEDLNAVLGNWNAGTPPTSGANIPEPGAVGVMTIGVAAGVLSRKRRRLYSIS